VTHILDLFDAPGWGGLLANLLAVWVALAVSVLGPPLLGIGFGAGVAGARDAPWTPPGWFIGAVWVVLYTLLGLALWTLNRLPAASPVSLKTGIYVLLAVLVTWTFYAFSQTSRWPGLLGNLAILLVSLFVVRSLWLHSRPAALLVLPVALWILVATATILDGARRYGW
jgi:translocator protein